MVRPEPLRLYGRESDAQVLSWDWVDTQLADAGLYWVVTRAEGHPHPRPVWGVWSDLRLYLSIGTPANLRALSTDPAVTVHLESGTDVVILEGGADGSSDDPSLLANYDRKYDWSYSVAEYGPLTRIVPQKILAWRSTGWAGRGGFEQTGRWQLS